MPDFFSWRNLALIIWTLLLLFAASSMVLGGSLGQNYRFKMLSSSEELKSLDVVVLYQQSDGHMWIGTDRGISRFDGYRYQHFYFNPGSNNHISNNIITSVVEDGEGNIWVGTEDGLNRIDKNLKVTIFNQKDGLQESWIVSLAFDALKNKIWLGTGYGLSSLNLETYSFEVIDGASENQIESTYDILLYPESNQLFIAGSNGLFEFNTDNYKVALAKDSSGEEITTSAISKLLYVDKAVWIATVSSGLLKLDKTNDTVKTISLGEDKKRSILITLGRDSQNRVWVGTYRQGVVIIDPDTSERTYLESQDFDRYSIPTNTIRSIVTDNNGFVWVGTKNGIGIYSHYQLGTRLYYRNSSPNSLSNNNVYQVYSIKKSLLALPTDNGINILDTKANTNQHVPLKNEAGELLPFQSAWNIAQVNKNKLLVAHDNGVYELNLRTKKLSPIFKGSINNSPVYVLNKFGDTLAVAGEASTGLVEIDLTNGRSRAALEDPNGLYQLSGNYTISMAKQDKYIYLGTTDSVFKVDMESGSFVQQDLSKSTQYLRATGLVFDNGGYLWVTTLGEGLVRLTPSDTGFEKNETIFLRETDGLPSNILSSLVLVGDDLWVAGVKEVFKVSTIDFTVKRYPSIFEIEGLSFFDNSVLWNGTDLFFGTNRGLLRIRPDMIKERHESQKIKIVGFKSNTLSFTDKVGANKEVQLPSIENDLRFEFSTFDYVYNKTISFRYKLIGVDKDWNITNKGVSNLYANLKPGSYQFEVEASTSDGTWNNNIAAIKFNISQPWTYYLFWFVGFISIIGLAIYLNERRKTISILDKKAHLDSLTGVSNRYSFNKYLDKLIDNEIESALILIDLDGFKEINDTYGHGIGDQFLIESSVRLTHVLREHDFIARLGGDEFSVLISKNHDLKYLNEITERIRQELARDYQIGDLTIVTSASIGVARYPMDSDKSESLVTCADAAMYEAKRNGRNLVCFYNQHLDKDLNLKLKIRAGLRTAISENQLSLAFQPKVDVSGKSVRGVEALLRWTHPEEGFISPAIFIPEAESSRQIIEIGYWVLESACKALHKLSSVSKDLTIAVNVSPIQITQPGFVQNVQKIISSYDIEPKCVELEITETTLVENSDACRFVLNNLKDAGVTVALDDFGVGYSSFSYLTQFPIDTLKIDKLFVDNLETDESNRIVLKHLINLTKDLGMKVVAEGVENEGQLRILSDLKADLIQGYFFSPPLTEEKLTEFLENHS